MWLVVWAGMAFAGQWDGRSGDVVAQRDLAVPPEAVFPLVQDLAVFRELFPADCADEWVLGATTAGVGARATIRYTISTVHRRLPAIVKVAEPSRLVDIEHEGKKGFTTRFELAPSPSGGTHVTMTSFLSPPPKPFQGAYFTKVQPAWQQCQSRALDALAQRAGAP